MPDNIVFEGIPVDIRTPGQYIEIDASKAVQGLPLMPRRILVLGQRLSTGSVPAGEPVRVLTGDQAAGFFGRGSLLAAMVAAAKEVNGTTEMWALALDDDPAGVAAAGSITVAAPATESGTLHLYVAGTHVKVKVTAGGSASALATLLAAAINARPDLPLTAAVDGGDPTKVNLAARHAGECGNAIDVRLDYYMGERTPAGLALTIAPLAGGSGNPDVADALAAIDGEPFYTIVTPWSDGANMVTLEDELSDRFGPLVQKTGHAFVGVSGSHATLSTWGAARNSPHTSCIGVYDSPTPPWIWAAVLAGVCEFHGAIDPARPFQTLALEGLLSPPEASRFSREERDLLLRDGVSTFLVDQGGRCLIERVVTTYQTNPFGIEDISFLDLETKWTVDYIRYAVRARIALRYPRYKLADDGTRFAPGQPIVTPKLIRAELLALFRELEEVGLVEGFDQFKRDLLVVRSQVDPSRVNAIIPPDVVNQFRVFAASVQFRL